MCSERIGMANYDRTGLRPSDIIERCRPAASAEPLRNTESEVFVVPMRRLWWGPPNHVHLVSVSRPRSFG